jgi:hypothetical protein
MAHQDAGHYGAKHKGKQLDHIVAARLKEIRTEPTISCAEAHRIAGELGITPAEIGTAIDLLELRIVRCQLGLFGHGKKGEKTVPVENPDQRLVEQITAQCESGKITCAALWVIADTLKRPRMEAAAVCEGMDIRVRACQLGAFR